MSSSAVCVALIVALFGNSTLMPSLVAVTFFRGRSTCMCWSDSSFISCVSPSKKFPVAPVSATITFEVDLSVVMLHV